MQYKIGIKNSEAIAKVIIEVDNTLFLMLLSIFCCIEFVAIVRSVATKIDFKNGLNNSTRKNSKTIEIVIKKYAGFKKVFLENYHLTYYHLVELI